MLQQTFSKTARLGTQTTKAERWDTGTGGFGTGTELDADQPYSVPDGCRTQLTGDAPSIRA